MFARAMLVAGVLSVLILGVQIGSAQAAPMAYMSVKARVAGSTGAFSDVVAVRSSNTSLEYRVYVTMAPVGTVNSYSVGTKVSARTITSLSTSDGANTSRFNIYQASSENIVVDFATSSALNPNYDGGGTGSGGTVTTRSGGGHDLLSVIAIGNTVGSEVYRAGVAGVNTPGPTQIASGTAALSSTGWTTGVDSTVSGSYLLPTSVPSTSVIMKGNFNSGTAFTYTPANIKIESPWGFNALVLYVPWASADVGGGTGHHYPVNENGVLSLDGSKSTFSSHTTASYMWDLDGDSQYDDASSTTPSLNMSWNQLLALGLLKGHTYNIGLRVTTGDGETGTATTGAGTLSLLPEPATVALLGLGAVLALTPRRRRK